MATKPTKLTDGTWQSRASTKDVNPADGSIVERVDYAGATQARAAAHAAAAAFPTWADRPCLGRAAQLRTAVPA